MKTELQTEWDVLMQKGYTFYRAGDSVAAALVWNELWDKMLTILNDEAGLCIEKLDQAFKGEQSIYNWATDYETALNNAISKDKTFAQKRIDFCTDYTARCEDESEPCWRADL